MEKCNPEWPTCDWNIVPCTFYNQRQKTDDTASDKYIWRISPLLRAIFSMTHVGHPEPYAKYLQKMVLNCAEKKSILEMVNAGLASNQVWPQTKFLHFCPQMGKRGLYPSRRLGLSQAKFRNGTLKWLLFDLRLQELALLKHW